MKKFLTILLLFFSLNAICQEKKQVKVINYNQKNAILTLNTNVQFKIIEELILKDTINMVSDKYINYKNNNSHKYKLKKILRLRPITLTKKKVFQLIKEGKTVEDIKYIELQNFFDNNFILEYWTDKSGLSLILQQKILRSVKLKKY